MRRAASLTSTLTAVMIPHCDVNRNICFGKGSQYIFNVGIFLWLPISIGCISIDDHTRRQGIGILQNSLNNQSKVVGHILSLPGSIQILIDVGIGNQHKIVVINKAVYRTPITFPESKQVP